MEIGLHFTPPNLKIYKYIQNEVFQIIKMSGGNVICSKKRKNYTYIVSYRTLWHSNSHTKTKMDQHSIYDIHKSLLREEIITNPRVMICSTRRMTIEDDFKQDKPYPKRIVRCGYVNECPICSYKQDRRLFARVLPIVKLLKENGGDIHLLTFTLRHNKSHSYRELKEVLHKSVKYIKSKYPY